MLLIEPAGRRRPSAWRRATAREGDALERTGKPLPADVSAKVLELHGRGLSRNAIARQLDIAPSSVSKIAHRASLGFDRAGTAKATAARVEDARALRTALELNLLRDAEKLRAQMWQPCVLHSFGGKDNTHNSIELTEPLFVDKRNLANSVGAVLDRAIKLGELNTGRGEGDAMSIVAALAGVITAAADELDKAAAVPAE